MLRLIHRPRPVPSFLRVTKGWNSSAQQLRRQAGAGVGDVDLDPLVAGVARGQRQRAALGHRVDGVDEQVDQHLLQLVAVDRRPPRGVQLRSPARCACATAGAPPAPGSRRSACAVSTLST